MPDLLVAVCPSCGQKYRVPTTSVGKRATCKKCGQLFKILEEPPIDDETIFGWVTEDDPTGTSVMGSTGIFGGGFNELTHVPVGNRWVHPPPPEQPRVNLDRVDETGSYFSFPAESLRDPDLRCSLPHRCAQCLGRDDLELHYIIWLEKVPGRDAAMINETETHTHRVLNKLLAEQGLGWFDALKPLDTLPAPYREPFPYCVCPQCSLIGAVRGRVLSTGVEVETCQIIIAHPSIALDFHRNNGGRNTPGYKKLLVIARQRRDNQWKALALGVRNKLAQWFTPAGDEKFLGYYADRDCERTERGAAGLVLTDRRMIYHKFAALREYPLEEGGTLEIEATRALASVEIAQRNCRESILSTTPLAASSLARTLTGLGKPWQINVVTHP